ncbi:MAG: hypothetical protein ACO3N3_10720, partial [bacterium]
SNQTLFINPEIIIPLPEAKDYILKKEIKQKEQRNSGYSSFSLERSNLSDDELLIRISESLQRPGDLTPRLRTFLKIILQEDRPYDREEVKNALYESGVGRDIGQTGRYLSNISQFLTKKSNPHLRQLVEFETGGAHGETKTDYHVLNQYRSLLENALQISEEIA